MADPRAAGYATVVFSIAVYSGASLLAALCGGAWGTIRSQPPKSQHEVLGDFGLWSVRLNVQFLPDPALPWKRPPQSLHIPWLEMRHIVEGPPGVRAFRGRCSTSRNFCDGGDVLIAEHGKPMKAQVNDWQSLTQRVDSHTGEIYLWPRTMLDAASVVQFRCTAAFAFVAAGVLIQVSGFAVLIAHPKRSIAFYLIASRSAAVFYLVAACMSLAAFMQYVSCIHSRFSVLVSEFVFALTEGGVVIWPSDMEVSLAAGAIFLCVGGLMALVSAVIMVVSSRRGTNVNTKALVHVIESPGGNPVMTTRCALTAESFVDVEENVQIGRLDVVAIFAIVAVLFLVSVFFAVFFGRSIVEHVVSKALRRPDHRIADTYRAALKVEHSVGRAARDVRQGSAWFIARSSGILQGTSTHAIAVAKFGGRGVARFGCRALKVLKTVYPASRRIFGGFADLVHDCGRGIWTAIMQLQMGIRRGVRCGSKCCCAVVRKSVAFQRRLRYSEIMSGKSIIFDQNIAAAPDDGIDETLSQPGQLSKTETDLSVVPVTSKSQRRSGYWPVIRKSRSPESAGTWFNQPNGHSGQRKSDEPAQHDGEKYQHQWHLSMPLQRARRLWSSWKNRRWSLSGVQTKLRKTET